jgi:hypothetical protein
MSDRLSAGLEKLISLARSFCEGHPDDQEGNEMLIEVCRDDELVSRVTANFSLRGTVLEEAICFLADHAKEDWRRRSYGISRTYVIHLMISNQKYRMSCRFRFSAAGIIESVESDFADDRDRERRAERKSDGLEQMVSFVRTFCEGHPTLRGEGGGVRLEFCRGDDVGIISYTFYTMRGAASDETISSLVDHAREDWIRCGRESSGSYVMYLLDLSTNYRVRYRFRFGADGVIDPIESERASGDVRDLARRAEMERLVGTASVPEAPRADDHEGGLPRRATHHLKSWPKYFQEVVGGKKPLEVRVDDRGFEVGDVVVLCEYDSKRCSDFSGSATRARALGYTGRDVRGEIVSVLRQSDLEWAEGRTVLGPDVVVMGMHWDVKISDR